MQKHKSKTKRPGQLELFGAGEYRSNPESQSWFLTHSNGKPDKPAMFRLHKKFKEEGQRREQRDLARFLSGTPHRNLSLLISDFEATKELEGPWEGTKVLIRSLTRFPRCQDLRYRLHYLYMDLDQLVSAAYWLREALRIERLNENKGKARPKPKRSTKPPRLIRGDPPRSIHYFFYACPFTWGEEKLDDYGEEEEW